jgi:hypothetical protein
LHIPCWARSYNIRVVYLQRTSATICSWYFDQGITYCDLGVAVWKEERFQETCPTYLNSQSKNVGGKGGESKIEKSWLFSQCLLIAHWLLTDCYTHYTQRLLRTCLTAQIMFLHFSTHTHTLTNVCRHMHLCVCMYITWQLIGGQIGIPATTTGETR